MNLTSIHSICTMTPTKVVSINKEVLIQRWQRQLLDRTHINFQEFMHLLRQHVWINSQISFLLFFFNIYETWSFVLFFFLFLSAIVGDILLLVRSWFKRVTLWIWMDWICIQSDRVCVHDILIYFVSTNIWSYISIFTGYPIAQKMFAHSNHSYVLLDIFRVDMIHFL